ncbi:hypothetical protein QJQ45_021361 [Haematococcus lacustris]|nr:hypothetical protein QJQ45_021361 [Haematococcus lacustris]
MSGLPAYPVARRPHQADVLHYLHPTGDADQASVLSPSHHQRRSRAKNGAGQSRLATVLFVGVVLCLPGALYFLTRSLSSPRAWGTQTDVYGQSSAPLLSLARVAALKKAALLAQQQRVLDEIQHLPRSSLHGATVPSQPDQAISQPADKDYLALAQAGPYPMRLKYPVLWGGAFFSRSGYGTEAVSYVASLLLEGLVRPADLWISQSGDYRHAVVQDSMEPALRRMLQGQELQELDQRLSEGERRRPVISVCHSFPDCWRTPQDDDTRWGPGGGKDGGQGGGPREGGQDGDQGLSLTLRKVLKAVGSFVKHQLLRHPWQDHGCPCPSHHIKEQVVYRVGRTMFETEHLPGPLAAYTQHVDEIWVPSEFNRQGFAASGVPLAKLFLLPEGINTTLFNPAAHTPLDLVALGGELLMGTPPPPTCAPPPTPGSDRQQGASQGGGGEGGGGGGHSSRAGRRLRQAGGPAGTPLTRAADRATQQEGLGRQAGEVLKGPEPGGGRQQQGSPPVSSSSADQAAGDASQPGHDRRAGREGGGLDSSGSGGGRARQGGQQPGKGSGGGEGGGASKRDALDWPRGQQAGAAANGTEGGGGPSRDLEGQGGEPGGAAVRSACRPFRFLSVFKWETRKGWDLLLQAYAAEFKGRSDVELHIFTKEAFEQVGSSFVSYVRRVAGPLLGISPGGAGEAAAWAALPRVYLHTQHVPEPDYPRVYRSVDALVIPTRGEGWGRPQIEAMAMALPVISTNWSGLTAFLDASVGYPLAIEGLAEVQDSGANAFEWFQGQRWALPSVPHLRHLMRFVVEHPQAAAAKGAAARARVVR